MLGREKYNKSPIFYMGNKHRLIKKGLIDLFPNNIDTFVDLFCGSGVVSMNVNANKYILNDINTTIINLLQMFKNNTSEDIISQMEDTINKFQLLKGSSNNDNRATKEYKQLAKERYFAFREFYNNNLNSNMNFLYLYVLSYYCNNNNIRFNSKGEFNMPLGNQYFNKERHSQKIIDGCEFFGKNNVYLLNEDFKNVELLNLTGNDFVYCDIPYSNTLAIYNEQQGWGLQDDKDVFALLEELNTKGIKWGLSNVFENKGKTNQHLIDWCENNNWKIHYFDNFNYVSCGKGNAETVEVYICNY